MSSIEQILSRYDEKVASLALHLRNTIIVHLPEIHEIPDESSNIIGFGYGRGYKDLICTIIPSKNGVKLGFYKGAELPDPSGILTGSGKVHKYVVIKNEAFVSSKELSKLLSCALKQYRMRTNSI
jgi:hypothetical protein